MARKLPANDPNVHVIREANRPDVMWTAKIDEDAYERTVGGPADRITPEKATGVLNIIDLEDPDTGEVKWVSTTIGGWAVDPMTLERVT